MNHQIIAALILGNAMRKFSDQPPEVIVGNAVVALMQMDANLSKDDAVKFVVTAMDEVSKIPYPLSQLQAEAAKMGFAFSVH